MYHMVKGELSVNLQIKNKNLTLLFKKNSQRTVNRYSGEISKG